MFELICRLALPASILSWKGVAYNEEVIDNPLDHDGRVRSFKHERGNWATLIYINCKYFDIKRYIISSTDINLHLVISSIDKTNLLNINMK